ncbi:MAG TPA: phage holin family protein [Candidatus Limnocylindria bacterium]|nr:phage holin family protein [Candidatus Limnocylindria bacterium]
MLLDLLMRVIINGIALILAVNFVPGVRAPGDILKLILLAVIFGLVNAYLRPIVKALSLPLTLVTFGLIGLVINVAMVLVAAAISDNLHLGLALGGWPLNDPQIGLDTIIAAFLVSLIITIVAAVVALVRKLTPGI